MISNLIFPVKDVCQNRCIKESVQWIHHPDDYWIICNLESFTYLQVTPPALLVEGVTRENMCQTQTHLVLRVVMPKARTRKPAIPKTITLKSTTALNSQHTKTATT